MRRNRTRWDRPRKPKFIKLCENTIKAAQLDKALDKVFGHSLKKLSGKDAFILGFKH